MKISYNWLKEYVDHDLAPEDLAERMTMAGLEVEVILTTGTALDGVVVGEVLETRKHPNADRLTLCRVNLGSGEPVQIVCGAPNVAAGQKVPVATVGTTLMLPGRDNPEERAPVQIKQARVRGEASHGMICSEDELGLSDDHSGILVLDGDARIGQPFADYLAGQGIPARDHVIDIAITPNRPDAISHIGVARDVAALTGGTLNVPSVPIPEPGGPAAEQVAVEIASPEACGRYVGLLVRGVTIRESPAWLKQRLTAIGLRPRNTVVDVTNYVMYECGQPLHAFDYDQIAGHKIIVRLTTDAHPFTTLDSKERTLPVGTTMICDGEREVAIGGIMGGENSEVTDATANVLIESAYFDPSTIRRAAKLLGLQTDASYRFERGVDPQGQVWAAARAAHLIAELSGGEVVGGMVDAHPNPMPLREVDVRPARIDRIIGTAIDREEAVRLLKAIGFGVADGDGGTLRCTVPSYRPDVEREIDVIEEVARLYGYDRVPEPGHMHLPALPPRERPVDQVRAQTLGLLGSLGYREIYTNSMQSKAVAERFNLPLLGAGLPGALVETLNPISQEMAALRPSLLPGLLQVMQFNQNHGQSVLRFVEFGHVFHRNERAEGLVPGYAEHEALIIGLSGPDAEPAWDTAPRPADFFDLKGVVESLLQALRIPRVKMEAHDTATDVTVHHLEVFSGKKPLGLIAQVAPALAEAYDLKAPAYFAELNAEMLVRLAAPRLVPRYRAVSRYPVVERDLALVVAAGQPVGPMLDAIRQAGTPLLQQAARFDHYEGDRVDADRKSVAFALRFGADRTLKDKEVDARIQAILKRLDQDFGAVLR
jgi:phenylalanyl-tRNA synthetase beta chain